MNTLAKVQPLCTKHCLDIGVYNLNSKRVLPQKVKKTICLYLCKIKSVYIGKKIGEPIYLTLLFR